METPRKFITAKLSIRKSGSSSVLIICEHIISTDEDPDLRIESFAVIYYVVFPQTKQLYNEFIFAKPQGVLNTSSYTC